MKTYGYVRVSSKNQNLDRQIIRLAKNNEEVISKEQIKEKSEEMIEPVLEKSDGVELVKVIPEAKQKEDINTSERLSVALEKENNAIVIDYL